jgi:hypothetical protein
MHLQYQRNKYIIPGIYKMTIQTFIKQQSDCKLKWIKMLKYIKINKNKNKNHVNTIHKSRVDAYLYIPINRACWNQFYILLVRIKITPCVPFVIFI